MFVGCCDIGLHIFVSDIVFTCSNVIILKNASTYSYYRAVDKRQTAMGKRSCSCTLVIAGVYTLFFNDILGPIGFMIRDMPIDMPAQFYHSWRYYWIVCYIYEVLWRWFWPSVIFLISFTLFRRTKDSTGYENNSSKINNARKPCEDL